MALSKSVLLTTIAVTGILIILSEPLIISTLIGRDPTDEELLFVYALSILVTIPCAIALFKLLKTDKWLAIALVTVIFLPGTIIDFVIEGWA